MARSRSRIRKLTFLLGLSLFPLQSACSGTAETTREQSNGPQVPENAIPIGEDIYVVPLNEPVDGCPAFRPFSPTAMVVQAIYYRTKAAYRDREGPFTIDRNKADCG